MTSTNRNRNGNDAAANNENAVLQEVTVNVGAKDGASAGGNGKDCYGQCHSCKSSRPSLCPIAQQYLPQHDYTNYQA